ncbi:flagellar basal body P-ring formation protein FlgA [Phreatobacter aquaticus]|uniref:Flagellar basal body P-ring formation protein FlgA n=2 Tax=Phreatobacter aquaticus TaxID=2570229 RepID=A0A4D7QS54_9HYPH|nr:flagellar basal body P-ring formation protein FlgA [Phreatobacter aquaticus]
MAAMILTCRRWMGTAALVLQCALAWPALAQQATLKAEVTVSEDIVRLGDLVDNAGRFAASPVFRAPDLGHTGQLASWRVLEAAKRLGLNGIATGDVSEVAVTRAARVIPLAELEERIAQTSARVLGVGDATKIQVTFDRGTRSIAVEPGAYGDLSVTRFELDARNGRFEATLEVRGSTLSQRSGGFRLSGQAAETVEFLVPARAINRGEVLKAADLVIERRPRFEVSSMSPDALSTLPQAVGLAARRPLAPERPFRSADLMKPEIVERNANVLIIYNANGLTLTIRGKALEAGSEGDVIQVQNLNSRKTLSAVITGTNQVTMTVRPDVGPQAAIRPAAPATPSPQ